MYYLCCWKLPNRSTRMMMTAGRSAIFCIITLIAVDATGAVNHSMTMDSTFSEAENILSTELPHGWYIICL